MIILSIAVASILAVAALFHFYWSFGGQFGIQSTAPKIQGHDEIKIPKFLAFIVACLITLLAMLAVLLVIENSPFKQYQSILGYAVACLLIIRAIGEFKYLGFFKKVYNSSFARKDTLFFSPLFLILGVSFFVLTKFTI